MDDLLSCRLIVRKTRRVNGSLGIAEKIARRPFTHNHDADGPQISSISAEGAVGDGKPAFSPLDPIPLDDAKIEQEQEERGGDAGQEGIVNIHVATSKMFQQHPACDPYRERVLTLMSRLEHRQSKDPLTDLGRLAILGYIYLYDLGHVIFTMSTVEERHCFLMALLLSAFPSQSAGFLFDKGPVYAVTFTPGTSLPQPLGHLQDAIVQEMRPDRSGLTEFGAIVLAGHLYKQDADASIEFLRTQDLDLRQFLAQKILYFIVQQQGAQCLSLLYGAVILVFEDSVTQQQVTAETGRSIRIGRLMVNYCQRVKVDTLKVEFYVKGDPPRRVWASDTMNTLGLQDGAIIEVRPAERDDMIARDHSPEKLNAPLIGNGTDKELHKPAGLRNPALQNLAMSGGK